VIAMLSTWPTSLDAGRHARAMEAFQATVRVLDSPASTV
jgi:hypothetical protein